MKLIRKKSPVYERVRGIIESARVGAARSVNTAQVISNWLIGREIVEDEQAGNAKADYGSRLLAALSERLRREYGSGYSVDNIELFRRFYQEYPVLSCKTALLKSGRPLISDALRRKSQPVSVETALSLRHVSWKPGMINPGLSWTHYRTLLRVGGWRQKVWRQTGTFSRPRSYR